ncbi:MAG: sodium-dependent transporter [Bacteroidaceae bacterium]|nr:sodium-dependent transporter [Bacteroidaceae bacterium]
MNTRASFGSKLGIIMAAAGSAVGLGNVWRFPTEVGANGGAAFILVYIVCILLLGLPVMLSEFLIGRHTHANTVDAYRQLAPGTWWVFQGYLGVFTAWFILCYYCVVSAWTMKYMVSAFCGQISAISDSAEYFAHFTGSPLEPVIYLLVIFIFTHFIIIRGVQKGIERFSKVMMPLLLLIIAILVVCSFSMPGSRAGMKFLLMPDFTKITSKVVLSALGQAFYSLSLAMGCLCTYASYFTDDAKLVKTAGSVISIDTTVAIMSGFIIFPAVFSVSEVAPDAGPGLVFITLPKVFQMAFSEYPIFVWLFALMFYLLLLIAALTSMISLHEPVTAFLHEHYKIGRQKAAVIVTAVCVSLGILCTLSFGPLADFKPFFGMGFFDFFDFVSAKIFLPVGGIIICLFTGWKLDSSLIWNELTNDGRIYIPKLFFWLFLFIIRFLAPVAIALIFANELGVFA